jgi:hypothetical protein
MTINDFAGTFALSTTMPLQIAPAVPQNSASSSSAQNYAIRMGAIAPLNISYLDPGGQQELFISVPVENGTLTMGASLTWWAAIFTMTGSTASVASSTSNSTFVSFTTSSAATASASSSVNVDGRFTNLTWNFTLGDYLLLVGTTMSASASYTGGAIVGMSFSASLLDTVFGATRAQVSYSVPYFPDGLVSSSLASYQLSQVTQSGGTNVTSVAPRIEFIGT